jgi:hypothetical protein
MKCDRCNEKAQWVRVTQFAGDHHFCDLHALLEEDFGKDDSYAFWAEMKWPPVVPESKLYVVDVVSTFRMRYVVEAKQEDHAWDEVVVRESDTEFKEFSQHHIGTHIFSSREVDTREYLELFDKDNSYLSKWTDEQKLGLINQIDY